MFSVERPASGRPANSIEPDERTMLQIARKVVVLPAPLAPRSVVRLPSSSEKVDPCSACTSPRRTFGELAAEIQRHDMVRDRHQETHVLFDQEHLT